MKKYIITGNEFVNNSDVQNTFDSYEEAKAQIDEWNDIDCMGGFEPESYTIIEEEV